MFNQHTKWYRDYISIMFNQHTKWYRDYISIMFNKHEVIQSSLWHYV